MLNRTNKLLNTSPLGYSLSAFTRPHIYLPLHGATFGEEPASLDYVYDKASVSTNGGTTLLNTSGEVPKHATPPASVWTDNPGWFVGDGTANSIFRDKYTDLGSPPPVLPGQAFFENWGVKGGTLVAFWFLAPSSNPSATAVPFDFGGRQNKNHFGIDFTATGSLRIRFAYDMSAHGIMAEVAGPAANTAGHYAWFFNHDNQTCTPYVNGIAGTPADISATGTLNTEASNLEGYLCVGGNGDVPNFFFNDGTGGTDAGISDILLIRYDDDVTTDLSAAIFELAEYTRGDIPPKIRDL